MRAEKRKRHTIVIKPSIVKRGKRLASRTGRKFYFLVEECLAQQFALIETHLEKREAALGPGK